VKYYVYALDTTNGQITAALSCRDEKMAKQAYQIAKRKFETEYGGTNSFHFGFTGVESGVCIEYAKHGWHKSERFDADDFEFAEEQTEKFLSKEKRGCETKYAHTDFDFLRYVKYAMTELFLGFDPSDVSATDEPAENKPPVKTIPPWKRVKTVIEETPIPQSDVADCPQQIQAATGAGVPDIVEAYQASIEDSDGTPVNVHDEKVFEAINALPGKIGSELQDALGMYHDQLNENEFEFAQRLKRTYPKKTYEEIVAIVGERFPDGKYQAGDGEKLRKALNPSTKNRKKNGNL